MCVCKSILDILDCKEAIVEGGQGLKKKLEAIYT